MTTSTTTLGTTDLVRRLDNILPGLLDGIQAMEEAITGRPLGDLKNRPHGLQEGLDHLKKATDALYVLDYAVNGEIVPPGDCFARARRR
jgi:hypothetical protein